MRLNLVWKKLVTLKRKEKEKSCWIEKHFHSCLKGGLMEREPKTEILQVNACEVAVTHEWVVTSTGHQGKQMLNHSCNQNYKGKEEWLTAQYMGRNLWLLTTGNYADLHTPSLPWVAFIKTQQLFQSVWKCCYSYTAISWQGDLTYCERSCNAFTSLINWIRTGTEQQWLTFTWLDVWKRWIMVLHKVLWSKYQSLIRF